MYWSVIPCDISVADAGTMDVAELRAYYAREIQDAKDSDILLSLHLKATMILRRGLWNARGLGSVLNSIRAKLPDPTIRPSRSHRKGRS